MAENPVPPFELRGVAYHYAQVADHIAARIRAGELRPDERLTGERDLAEEYGFALGTIRRAIEELRDRGYVVTLAAKGTYVTQPDKWPAVEGQSEEG